MMAILRALKNLVSVGAARPTHDQLDHRHWNRETRTWRSHADERGDEEAAA